MRIKVEMSLYPLTENYIPVIKGFIEDLKANQDLIVESNSMSTQVEGEHDIVMPLITNSIVKVLDQQRSSLVMKIIKSKD